LSQPAVDKILKNRGFERVPMRVNSAMNPEVDCSINGISSSIVVETAAFSTIILDRIARRAGIHLAETGTFVEGVGKRKAALKSGVAKEFSVGNFRTHDQKLYAEEGAFGVLGIDYLRAHQAIIDCGGMSLYLRH
jgi:hypothetical protein